MKTFYWCTHFSRASAYFSHSDKRKCTAKKMKKKTVELRKSPRNKSHKANEVRTLRQIIHLFDVVVFVFGKYATQEK